MSIMNAIRRSLPLALAAALALAGSARAQESTDKDLSIDAVAGGQLVNDVDDRGVARFEEFREVPEGVLLEHFRLGFAPAGKSLDLSLTAQNAGRDDQRYFLNLWLPGTLRFDASYRETPRFYSSGSKTLWAGAGTGHLTIDETFRAGAEAAAGAPTSPFASSALKAYMDAALASANPFDLKMKRKDLKGSVDFTIAKGFTLTVAGRNERRDGTKPLGFGTYIRRQALAGTPGTGAGSFWRETVEARGSELIEPVKYKTNEFSATLTWAKNGHSATAGWFGSRFRNDITSLYFDNPFEGSPGRASASVFDPKADQEPSAPNGNNQFRGLYARSAIQLWPNNDYDRLFATGSFRLGARTRVSATLARGTMKQDDRFMPYAENPLVVASQVNQPIVYAKDLPLPQASLDGKMVTTQADVKLTSRLTDALDLRAGYRYYDLKDDRPSILFPGFSSSGDSYFRAGIGQKDAAGNRILFNVLGGYDRQRMNLGAAYRVGNVTVDGEVLRTLWDYDHRQVESTEENAFRGAVRVAVGEANVNAFYLRSNRRYEGGYVVGLETSGVRAYDVWDRNRDQVGADVDMHLSDDLVVALGGAWVKDRYPGAVAGFANGYGLQDSKSASVFASATYTKDQLLFTAFAGYEKYDWNSLQVTKTSLGADYNPTNRWTRASEDDTYWVGFETIIPITKSARIRADVSYQRFTGDWITENIGTPDVNSAVAYDFPGLSDSTLTIRTAGVYDFSDNLGLELRYWYEPYRLDDFTIDQMKPYMQGEFKETRSAPTDIGDANVSRFLFLDARYSSYTAHVLSALFHVRF